jgi:1,4-alpha-glucan branching enzyme
MVTQTPNGKMLFEFHRPDIQQMAIAGDFNGWQHSFQMLRGRDGWWRATIQLAPGTYRFRYIADGQWFTDYAAFGLEPGPYGWNSVLKVDPVQPAAPVIEREPAADLLEAAMALSAAESGAEDSSGESWSEPLTSRTPRRVRRRPAMAGHT